MHTENSKHDDTFCAVNWNDPGNKRETHQEKNLQICRKPRLNLAVFSPFFSYKWRLISAGDF